MTKGSLFFKPKPRDKEISRKRWNWPSIVGRAIRKTCTFIGAVILISALLTVAMSMSMVGEGKVQAPKEMILALTIDSGVGEQGQEPTLMDPFPFRRPTVRQIVDAIDVARFDDRVKALAVNLESGGMEIAHIQEIREAVKRFRTEGKKTYIYSSSYGDLGEGMGSYYFASVFDEIWMQPVGVVSIAGIDMQVPFARAFLEKLGARAQFLHREEYKNAMESFTSDAMSEPSRESMQAIVDSLAAQMAGGIAADRKMNPGMFRGAVSKGVLTGKEALAAGLIDRLDYADVLIEEMQTAAGGDPEKDQPELFALETYDISRSHVGDPKVALIYASGMIAPAGSGEGVADAGRIAAAIAEAADNDQYKTIVIRIDSPGGSPSASETIRRAIVKAKEDGKIVIVSMGPVAASGGYWIATDVDRIYALPSTLTGSIGVIMGKFELSGLWGKLGVTWDGVSWGENAGLFSISKPFNAAELARMNILIDDIYVSFVDRVAAGRKLPRDKVLQIAKGRAWTGADAKNIGLIDEFGGLDTALDYAASLSGANNRHGVAIDVLPKPQGPFERFVAMFGAQARVAHILGAFQNRMNILDGGTLSYDPALDFAR